MNFKIIYKGEYETIKGTKETKTVSEFISKDKTKHCEIECWGKSGDTTVRFFNDLTKGSCVYQKDFGRYEDALGACYRFFSGK